MGFISVLCFTLGFIMLAALNCLALRRTWCVGLMKHVLVIDTTPWTEISRGNNESNNLPSLLSRIFTEITKTTVAPKKGSRRNMVEYCILDRRKFNRPARTPAKDSVGLSIHSSNSLKAAIST
jgi:hypothetical protein